MRKLTSAVLAVTVFVSGCASNSNQIAASYSSPLQYQSYDCSQIVQESDRIKSRLVATGGQIDKAADNDKVITGAAIILFWPAAFFLGGNKQQEAEFARLKGDYDALQQAAVIKKCMTAGK